MNDIPGKASANEKGDPKQAYKYYERGCELKDADSCLHSGESLKIPTQFLTIISSQVSSWLVSRCHSLSREMS